MPVDSNSKILSKNPNTIITIHLVSWGLNVLTFKNKDSTAYTRVWWHVSNLSTWNYSGTCPTLVDDMPDDTWVLNFLKGSHPKSHEPYKWFCKDCCMCLYLWFDCIIKKVVLGDKSAYHLKSFSHPHVSISGVQAKSFSIIKISTYFLLLYASHWKKNLELSLSYF